MDKNLAKLIPLRILLWLLFAAGTLLPHSFRLTFQRFLYPFLLPCAHLRVEYADFQRLWPCHYKFIFGLT
jgi:hypothetical protein